MTNPIQIPAPPAVRPWCVMHEQPKAQSGPTHREPQGMPLGRVLVIGDWFIDENWMLSPQEFYHSTASGLRHYLARQDHIDKRMVTLCGAAMVVSVFRSLQAGDKLPRAARFHGIGIWNPVDQPVLKCTMCPLRHKQKLLTPYTIRSLMKIPTDSSCPYDPSSQCSHVTLELANLGPEYDETKSDAEPPHVSTNRIVRCFEGYGSSEPNLLYRFDWILPAPPSPDYRPLLALITDDPADRISAIVIEDHGYGVVTPSLVKILARCLETKGQSPPWYVRTKIDDAEWLHCLPADVVDLFVIDFKTASHRKGERRWWIGREPGRAAIELLQEFHFKGPPATSADAPVNPRARNVAVLMDENVVLAMDSQSEISIHDRGGPRQPINIGRTTAFFSLLTAQRLRDLGGNQSFQQQCHLALQCAYEWSRSASSAWNRQDEHFGGEIAKAMAPLDTSPPRDWPICKYAETVELWSKSQRDLGIVTAVRGGLAQPVLQLWRAEGTLRGYLCVGDEKRRKIDQLVSEVARFAGGRKEGRPLGALLIGAPGWGKSFLGKCLARHVDLEFLEFSFAQMSDTRDLVDCLSVIASVQSRSSRHVMVFMDELNAEIEGHSAMGLLLAPLWDGLFMREGKTHSLKPATWIFASTEGTESLRARNKGEDFVSRLNGPVVDLDGRGTDRRLDRGRPPDDPIRTEQVYMMVTLLMNQWGPIGRIEKRVLELFRDMDPVSGCRSMEFFAQSFEGIRRGEVHANNVPILMSDQAIDRHIAAPMSWPVKRLDGNAEFIRIEGSPEASGG